MSTAAKVGAFFLVVLVIGGLLIWRIEDIRVGKGKAQRVTAEFKDVAGLDEKSAVRVAGVRVGKVGRIGVDPETGKARVELEIDPGVELRQGAVPQIANMGLLGEKYVELYPGPPGAAPLPEGSVLRGDVPVGFDDITKLARDIEVQIKEISTSLNRSLGGAEGEERLKAIVENVRAITDNLRVLVASNRGNVDETMVNFKEFSAMMTKLVDRIDRLVASNSDNVTQGIANIRDISKTLETTAENLNQITGKIQSGQGTLGKLVQSEETHKNINETLASVKEGVEQSEPGGRRGAPDAVRLRRARGVPVQRRPDAGLLHPRHHPARQPAVLRARARHAAQRPARGHHPDRQDDVSGRAHGDHDPRGDHLQGRAGDHGPLRISVEGPCLEGRPDRVARAAAAIDYLTLKKRLWFSGQIWDFDRPANFAPHAKLSTRYYFSPSVYLTGGWDDFLNTSRKADSIFLGAGIRWTDDELKYLLGSVPVRP